MGTFWRPIAFIDQIQCLEGFSVNDSEPGEASRTVVSTERGRDYEASEFQPLTWLRNGQSTSLQGRGPLQPGSDDHGDAADRHRGDEHPT